MLDSSNGTQWERQTVQKILLEHISEQRRARRWSIFFRLVIVFLIIAVLLYSVMTKDISQPTMLTKSHTAIIDIKGEIGAEHNASVDNIRSALNSAFKNKHVKGVILRINSPGGSPVQARQVFDLVRSLKEEHSAIPVYATIEDLGTSAAYLIACAAEAIYADKTSLVGSIGARIDSFGFVGAMEKVGVERRLYTAGSHKGILDPFSPATPSDVQFIEKQLDIVHQAFIQNVKEGRGDRLHETPEIFSGLFWCGEEALGLGLIDGYGDAYSVAKNIVKAEEVVDYTKSTNLFYRLANELGTSMGQVFSSELRSGLKGVQ